MTSVAPHCAPPGSPTEPVEPPSSARAPDVSSWRLLATLGIAGAAAGLLVVGVYRATLPTIERYAAQKEAGAVREVLAAPARWDTLYLVKGALTKTVPADERKSLPHAYLGFDASGKATGAAITAQEPGFQEEVLLMIGFEPTSGRLIGFKVLEQKETPGLGDKIESDSSFGLQFAHRLTPLTGVKGRAPANDHEVQTITGATISSRAVIRIIDHAIEKWQPLLVAYASRGGA